MFTRIRSRYTGDGKGPWILASALLVALLVTPFAVAAGEGGALRGGARNPGNNESQAYTRETEVIANNGTYGTRQSNKSNNGGGAIYGCRSGAGGTEKGNKPCIRSSNLEKGRAFEFSSGGTEIGRIEGPANAAPFTTTATGVATGLNADRVDGKNADDITKDATTAATKDATTAAQAQNKFAAVAADGTLGTNRGVTASTVTAAGTYTVTFADDISKCALNATVTAVDVPATIAVRATGAKTLEVVTHTITAATPPTANRPFHVTVVC
jgi:hypothetical protein